MSYQNPSVVLLSDPVGIDSAIQKVQIRLADNLPWIDKAFGRAIMQRGLVSRNEAKTNSPATNVRREVVYPECYLENQEPINMMPNDNLKASCFFLVNDPGEFINYEPMQAQTLMRYSISIIFWFNLKKIDSTKDFRYTEELKRDVIRALVSCPEITLQATIENYDNIYREFTLTETYRQFLKPPNGGFRFNCLLSFPEFNELIC